MLQGVARRVFDVFMEACRLGTNKSYVPEDLLIQDPQKIKDIVYFKKQKPSLVDVEFKAWDLQLGGLHNLEVENFHVVRHMGLKDVRCWANVSIFHPSN